jgi:hypothetical protein
MIKEFAEYEKLDPIKDVDKLLEISRCKAFYIIFDNKTKDEVSMPLDYCSGEFATLLRNETIKPFKKSNMIPITKKNALMLIAEWDYQYEIKTDPVEKDREILIIQYDIPSLTENKIFESDSQTFKKLQFIREQIRNITRIIRDIDWRKTTENERGDIIYSLENLTDLAKNKTI